jgi:surface protein
MGIIVNNIKPIRIIFNGVEATLYHNGIKIWPEGSDPYNPLNLPPNTVRVRTNDGNVPFKTNNTSYETATLVPGTTDVYDVYKSGTDFSRLLQESSNVIEVIGANTSNITDASRMFSGCSNLTTVPLFDTSKATSMRNMFQNCTRVQSGALALYQQASSQANPPSNHSMTFYKCGSNTTTGAAELAQIPSDWK